MCSHIGQSLAFYSEDSCVLCAGGDFELFCSVEAWYGDSCSECSLSETYGDYGNKVISISLEEFVWFYSDVAIEVTPWSATSARLAFCGDPDGLAFVNAGGDFDINDSFLWYGSGAPAFFSWVCNNLSCAAALRAGGDHLEKSAPSCDLA